MNRRDFLKFSSCGLTFVAVGSTMPLLMKGNLAFAQTSSDQLELDIVDALAEMVDGVQVPMWAFKINDSSPLGSIDLKGQARIPGPALFVMEGDTVRLRIRNRNAGGHRHAFAIPGVVPPTAELASGERAEVEFVAPKAGTYIYLDPLNAPVNRVMGLHGVLVVLPNPVGSNTPFSDPTAKIQELFNDLGNPAKGFPGHPWDSDRNVVWVFNTVDPGKNTQAASPAGITAAEFLNGYLPQYFTINGKSGFFSAQHHHQGGEGAHPASRFDFDLQANISVSGRVGQPTLIRNVNAGLMWHSPHIHGNHVYELAENGIPRTNLFMLDTWAMPPLHRKELLLPFIMPPDIPANRSVIDLDGNVLEGEDARLAWPPFDEKFPLLYPMHDHNEISNTAAGGNYPHGLATHWQIDGVIDPTAAVIQVTRAEYRVRTGQLILEGRSSTPGIELEIHPGEETTSIGHAHVHGNGHWSFRGRSLRALVHRTVSIMAHGGNPSVIHASRTVPLQFR